MKALALLAMLLLAGCTPHMSNEAIIAETKKCHAAGMRAVQFSTFASMDRTMAVECRQKEAAP